MNLSAPEVAEMTGLLAVVGYGVMFALVMRVVIRWQVSKRDVRGDAWVK